MGGGQRVLELSDPLTHLGDLPVELLCVGEDEAEGVQSNGTGIRPRGEELTESHGQHARNLNADRQINSLPLRRRLAHRWDLW